MLFLKYGRDAENQADELGFRYALSQNYDVREMANVFETLNRASQVEGGGGRLPEWLSTHPNPENRVKRTEERLDTLHASLTSTIVNRDEYLKQIDGLDLRRRPAAGLLRGRHVLPPRHAVPAQVPGGMEDPEHAQRRGRDQPEGGRDHPARPGGQRLPS